MRVERIIRRMARLGLVLLALIATGTQASGWCGDGAPDPGEDCDLGFVLNGSAENCCTVFCEFRDAGETCRAAGPSGRCDPAETCTGASDSCPADALLSGADGASFDSETGHCYAGFRSAPLDWESARISCESIGGYLAVLDADADSSGDTAVARSATTFADAVWVGIHDSELEAGVNDKGFATVKGNTVHANVGFAFNEPTGESGTNCVHFFANAFTLNDEFCTNVLPYVCELEASSCGDGVLQAGEQCDLGVQNGKTSSCCTSSCQFQPISTTCRSAGPCELSDSVCSGAAGACPSTGDFLGNADTANIDQRTGHCYLDFSDTTTWAGAQQACEGLAGYLAVIDDGVENALVRHTSTVGEDPWLGFHDFDGETNNGPRFEKVTGGYIGAFYDAFALGEPNNSGGDEDCGQFIGNSFLWKDGDCDQLRQYICEIPPPVICSVTPLPPSECHYESSAAKGSLQLHEKTGDPARSGLKWKWSGGPAALSEVGNPVYATDYRFCVYDGAGSLQLDAAIPSGGVCQGKACWKRLGKAGSNGAKYKSKDGLPDGITAFSFKLDGHGGGKINLKGRGSALSIPTLPLAQTPAAAEAQLINGNACWAARYSSPADSDPLDADRFKDENDLVE